MKLPISWLKDFIDLDGLTIEDIARKLTLAGLEVDEILYAGLPMPTYGAGEKHEFKTNGIAWNREKIVVAEIREVKPHPTRTINPARPVRWSARAGCADRRTKHLSFEGYGQTTQTDQSRICQGRSNDLRWSRGWIVLTTLKRAKIRGVDSYSMVCSEKELGITEEHEGIILLDDDAPVGMPLADYIGDAVLDISILPNMARNANVIGIARELAALTGRQLNSQKSNSRPQVIQLKIWSPLKSPTPN